PAYRAANGTKLKRQLIVSRAAAKDAARLWWSRRYGTALPYPDQLLINRTESGQPYLEPFGDPSLPSISIAHTENVAIAVAAEAAVGIDLEPIHAKAHEILPQFATTEEINLLEGLQSRQGP